jgi:cellobiose-specific phosphotransferase system component IIB
MSVEINKRFVATWGIIGSVVLGILGFIGTQYFEVAKDYMDKVNDTQTELVLLKQKINDDDSQWQILQRQDEKIQTQEVEIRVLKMVVQRMSEDHSGKNITIKIEGSGIENLERTINQSDEVELKNPPKPVEPPEEVEKIFEDLEKKIEVIQQRAFPNQRDFKK